MGKSDLNASGNLYPKPWAAAIAAGVLTSIIGLPQVARSELVYEDSAPSKAESVRIDDRGTLRQTLSTAERARDTRMAEAAQAPAPVQPPVVYQAPIQQPAALAPAQAMAQAPAQETYAASAPEARAGDSVEDLRNMNKTELMRRQRVREELRNEDALQERLEELRLRDEKRRTDQILGIQGASGASGAPAIALPTPVYGGMQEQTVSAPVTEHPGQAPQAPQAAPAEARGVQLAGVASANAGEQAPSQMTASVELEKSREKSVFYISPRAGLGNMSSPGGYDIKPHFAGGVAAGVATSDYLSFELGYTYAEYGLDIASGNPLIQQIQYSQNLYGNNGLNSNTLTFKQNVIDAGIKLHLLDASARLRPFVGGGGAWSKGYINYDQNILNALKVNSGYSNSALTSDYELTSYLGYVSGGLDVKMNQSISVGLLAKYYAVLSSSENSALNNAAFYNSAVAQQSPEKLVAGGSMSKTNFYTIMGNVSFAF